MIKQNTMRTFRQEIKQSHWFILLINFLYYFCFIIATIIFWFASLDLISKIKPLLDFFVDVAKPVYQATGLMDPYTLSQVFSFSDLLHVTINQIILFALLFILAFSILRGLKDWLLLKKKQSAYLHILLVLFVSLFLVFLSVLLLVKLNSVLAYLIVPILFFILHKYSLLMTQGIIINKYVSKRLLSLIGLQILSYVALVISVVLIWFIISFIFSAILIIGVIIFLILAFILLINREQYLLTFLLVKK
jgi:hypothetical protein